MIALVGATGFTGALVARELARRGLPAVWIARSGDRMDALASALGVDVERRVATPTDPGGLVTALAGSTVVIDTVGPFTQLGEPVVAAAIDLGAHYVDTTGEQGFMRAMLDRHDAAARRASVAVLCACAFEYAVGECVAAVALHGFDEPAEVDVYYVVMGGAVSHGTAKSALRVAAEGGVRLQDGALVRERLEAGSVAVPGADKPRTVISVPGGEALHLPQHARVRSVRTWMAVPPPTARWLAASPLLAALKLGPVRRLADRLVDARVREPSPEQREAARFVVLARARAGTREVWRSVTGRDPYALTAALTVEAAARLSSPPRALGVSSAAAAFDPAAFLAGVGLTVS